MRDGRLTGTQVHKPGGLRSEKKIKKKSLQRVHFIFLYHKPIFTLTLVACVWYFNILDHNVNHSRHTSGTILGWDSIYFLILAPFGILFCPCLHVLEGIDEVSVV